MPYRSLSGALALSAVLAAPALAAEFDDPTWPCMQRKVENLSPGLMWPAPIPEDKPAPEIADRIDALEQRLVLRRVDMEQAESFVTDFAEETGADMDMMGRVFGAVFTDMARDRRRIMAGIAEYSQKQIGLSDRIETARDEMDAIMARDDKSDADFDRVDTLEQQVDWDERIYTDRQKSLTYVCETPVLLEKRLYSIAQLLQKHAAK